MNTVESLYAESFGYALAMRVLQSDLYASLDGRERAECDELITRGQGRHAAAELVSASLVAPQWITPEAGKRAEAELIAELDGLARPLEVRMLTHQEYEDLYLLPFAPGNNIVSATVRKCAEIWGLSIKEQAVKPATDKEMPK